MGMVTSANYSRESWPVDLVMTATGSMARIECAQCGARDEWRVTNRPPPEVLPKHFQQKGWETRRKPTCPECAKKKEVRMPSVTQIKPAANDKPVASDAARKAKQLLFLELMDAYDDTAKCYRTGHTDKTLADKLGISEGTVRAFREENFGPLSEPKEFTELRDKLAALQRDVASVSVQLQEATKRWA